MSRLSESPARTARRARWLRCVALLAALLALPAHAGEALEVRVEGLAGELLENVLGYLAIAQARGDDALSVERIQLLHRRAPAQIREALEPFGHYRPEVAAELLQTDAGWLAAYRVDAGPPIRLGRVDVELLGDAAEDPAFAELLAAFPVREGAVLRHADYERAREALQRRATGRGYFDARLTRRELRIDLDSYRAEVALTLDAGHRYRFGKVRFDQSLLDPELLAGYVPFAEGDPYLGGKLLDLQTALVDSGYYAEVAVTPQVGEAEEGRIPVDVALTARPRHRYTAGIGYGTDTGMRGRLGWEWRVVNRQGHRMNAGLELAERRTSLLASYSIPVRDPRTEQLVFSGTLLDEQTDIARSRSEVLGASLQLGRNDWRMNYSLDLKRERSEIAGERQDAVLVIPGVTWSRVYAEDDAHALGDYRLGVDLHGGSTALGSDVSFVQLRLDGKLIVAAPWRGGRLLGRLELGTTWTDDFGALPVSERFFAGGDQSIRGYAWKSLGPVGSSGEVVGGRNLAVGSLEYEHYFTDKWGVALFQDIGYAFDAASDPFYRGRGIGLRWRSPIGTVRLDIAQAQDGSREPWRLHFVVGPDL